MLEISFTCPMCGRTLSANEKRCPECGESTERKPRRDETLDRFISFITGGIGIVICLLLLVQLEPSLKLIGLLMGCGWFWAPPLTCIAWYQSLPHAVVSLSPWRIFWRVQAAVLVLTLSLIVLCMGVCTPASFH